jgi:hypothetical protein
LKEAHQIIEYKDNDRRRLEQQTRESLEESRQLRAQLDEQKLQLQTEHERQPSRTRADTERARTQLHEQRIQLQTQFTSAVSELKTQFASAIQAQVAAATAQLTAKCSEAEANAQASITARATAEERCKRRLAENKDLQTRYEFTKRQLENCTDSTDKHTQTDEVKRFNTTTQCETMTTHAIACQADIATTDDRKVKTSVMTQDTETMTDDLTQHSEKRSDSEKLTTHKTPTLHTEVQTDETWTDGEYLNTWDTWQTEVVENVSRNDENAQRVRQTIRQWGFAPRESAIVRRKTRKCPEVGLNAEMTVH